MAAMSLQQSTQVRRFRLKHVTSYDYDRPIERSAHRLHLRPIHDWKQRVCAHRIEVMPVANVLEHEDAFGNWTNLFEVAEPYRQMTIVSESTVELLDIDPFAFANLPIRPTFPLSWMPWDHKVLSPYLTPIELPEAQLVELYDYAMSFVEQNHHDLMETLFAINLTFFREYQYQPGSTNLATTPYDVLVNKRGVCQDFSNLFICLARLLGLPARYVCGYLFTGNRAAEENANGNQVVNVNGANNGASPLNSANSPPAAPPSDATHAWVQLYIPNVGWKGFDPTNGVLPSTEHVRVSVGRHYRDTSPVSGTLYTMATENMTTTVEMVEESGMDGAR